MSDENKHPLPPSDIIPAEEEVGTQVEGTTAPDPEDDSSSDIDDFFGGPLEESKPAFALLTGKYEDTKQSSLTKLSVPLTTLPAILGRTQTTTNKHVFDLGNCKQLSRKHAVIFYCDANGTRIGKHSSDPSDKNKDKDIKIDDEWSYREFTGKIKPTLIHKKNQNLPKEGFFAIECLSKNKIIVDGKRVDQGKIAVLDHMSTIKVLQYSLYFLLPEDAKPRTVSMAHPDEDDGSDDGNSPPKRVKRENELEHKSISELLSDFNSAVESNNFDRKASMVSTQILQHAVKDASKDSKLRKICKSEDGISRHLLIDWIADSDLYGNYVALLLTKLEMKSYQQNLSKAMRKGGYFRIGNAGRHIKWLLPGIKLSGERSDEDEVGKDDETKGSKVTEKASNEDEDKKETKGEDEDENNLEQDQNRSNDSDDQGSDVPIEDE